MAGELAISSVALSKRRRSLPDAIDGHRDIWFDVTIRVENRSNKPLHVVDELRGIAFDATSRVLSLRLCEPLPRPVQKDAPTFHLPTPRTLKVGPHESASIVVEIPAVLKELRAGPEFVPIVETTDLRAMQTIRCEVACSERPIESRGAETAHQMRTRLQNWATVVSKETPVEPDMRDSESEQTPDAPRPGKSRKR